MKKFLLTVVAILGVSLMSFAVPEGKYDANDGSYVLVSGKYIFLYIDGYRAGEFYIEEEYDDGSFVAIVGSDTYEGYWYESNGEIYLKLGKRTLIMTERY